PPRAGVPTSGEVARRSSGLRAVASAEVCEVGRRGKVLTQFPDASPAPLPLAGVRAFGEVDRVATACPVALSRGPEGAFRRLYAKNLKRFVRKQSPLSEQTEPSRRSILSI